MKTSKTMMSLLLLSAVFITPASANWFSNPRTGTNLNIGSAPNPTPADLRAIGEGKLTLASTAEPRSSPTEVVYVQTTNSVHPMNTAQLTGMEGRQVWGSHGEKLGYILAVNNGSRLVELQTPKGIAVSMPASLLMEKNGRMVAPTTSQADVIAMEKSQTGRTVAINIDRRNHAFRG